MRPRTAVIVMFVSTTLALRRHRQFDERALMERLDAIDKHLASIAAGPPHDQG